MANTLWDRLVPLSVPHNASSLEGLPHSHMVTNWVCNYHTYSPSCLQGCQPQQMGTQRTVVLAWEPSSPRSADNQKLGAAVPPRTSTSGDPETLAQRIFEDVLEKRKFSGPSLEPSDGNYRGGALRCVS